MGQSRKYIGFADEDSNHVKCRIDIVEKAGNLFDTQYDSILIHACNCMGTWSAGIAAEFTKRYPYAYEKYRRICRENNPLGTAAILYPPDNQSPKHYIVCLFTSYNYGKRKDSPDKILANTKTALNDMFRQILDNGLQDLEIRMCKINSNFFGVPWSSTKNLIQTLDVGRQWTINVVDINMCKRQIGFID